MRDLYELGDLQRPEYIARRDAIHTELSALAPQPIPDLDHAQQVLEDFTVFWEKETDPAAKRQFLSLIFEGVWLDETASSPSSPSRHSSPSSRIDAQQSVACAGVKYGSDGGQTLDCCLTGCHLAGRPADRDPLVAVRVAYSRRRAGAGQPRRRAAWRRAFQAITARLPQKRNTGRPTSLTHPPTATPATIATTAAMLRSRTVQGVGGLRAHRSAAVAMLRTVPGRGAQSPRRCENWAGVSIGGLVPIRSVRSRSPDTSTSTCAVSARASR